MYVRCQKHLNSIFFQFMKLTVALYCCIIRFMHLASKHIIRVAVGNYSFLTAGNIVLSMLCRFYEKNSQFLKKDFNEYKNIQISHLLIKHSPNLWEEQGRQTEGKWHNSFITAYWLSVVIQKSLFLYWCHIHLGIMSCRTHFLMRFCELGHSKMISYTL